MSDLVERTIGRRLLYRLWFHGVLLFAGAIALAIGVRHLAAAPPRAWPAHGLLLLATALVFALVFVAGPIATSIVRPIRALRAQAAAIGAGDLTARSGSTRRDELGDLARSLDAMGAQLARLRGAERQLLGDVSHELRTPLARMRVVLELAERAEPAEVRRYLGEVATDLGELEALVDDIIASARLDAADGSWGEARVPMRIAPVAVSEVVDAAVARFRARWPTRTLEVDAPAAGLVVAADAALLRRAIDNLLANARAYSDAAITIRAVAAPGGVRLEVIDRGVGIAAEDQPRVFTPLFRADRSRSRASGGVGLGLALARRIVVAHGGAIGFTSEVDHGSTFWLTLPA